MRVNLLLISLQIFLLTMACTNSPELTRNYRQPEGKESDDIATVSSEVQLVFLAKTFADIPGKKTININYGNYFEEYNLETEDEIVRITLNSFPVGITQNFVVQVTDTEGEIIKKAELTNLKLSKDVDDKIVIDECYWKDTIWSGEVNVQGCQWEIVTTN